MEDYEEDSFLNSRYYVKKGEPIIVEGKPIVIPDVESYELSSTPTSGATFDPDSIVSAIDKITTTELEYDFISFIDDFKEKIPRISKDLAIQNLKEAYNKKDLVFVFGSGISIEQGVPGWRKLLTELMAKAIAEEMHVRIKQARIYAEVYVKQLARSSLIIARHIRRHLGGGLTLESKTKENIYKKINLNPSPLFKELLEYFKNTTAKKGINSVITFNYDNLIEYFCKNNSPKIPFRPIYSKKMDESGRGIPIYHVHGYLPKAKVKRVGNDNRIVLSEETYHEQYVDIYNWSNLIQIEKYMHKTCLFIGISFTDPNLRRLLEIAKKQVSRENTHYLIFNRGEKKIKNDIQKILDKNPELLERKIRSDMSFENLYEKMLDLIYTFEEEDLRSFGIEIIWIDDFDEIPKLLKKIRK